MFEYGVYIPRRLTLFSGLMAGLLVSPAVGLAGGKPVVYHASHLTNKATCRHTGISGPTGNVVLFVYIVRRSHPAASAITCSRAVAVGEAGKKYMFSKLSESYGTAFHVHGAKYTVEQFIFRGASGPAPAFVGAKTIVAAQYASGR